MGCFLYAIQPSRKIIDGNINVKMNKQEFDTLDAM